MKLRPLDQQVMVVTGASSGIGRATALLAAKRGAAVVCAARNPERIVIGDAATRRVQVRPFNAKWTDAAFAHRFAPAAPSASYIVAVNL